MLNVLCKHPARHKGEITSHMQSPTTLKYMPGYKSCQYTFWIDSIFHLALCCNVLGSKYKQLSKSNIFPLKMQMIKIKGSERNTIYCLPIPQEKYED